ncbi:MAG TPA: hypothetical protein VMM36_19205 [Opitutaceae bacterium]|nr:hypothetical protein [Opitutaceae bacterium]
MSLVEYSEVETEPCGARCGGQDWRTLVSRDYDRLPEVVAQSQEMIRQHPWLCVARYAEFVNVGDKLRPFRFGGIMIAANAKPVCSISA